MLRNCQYLVKTTLAVYLIFYKLIFLGTLLIFLKPTIKLITEIFDCKINNNSYYDGTSAFVRCLMFDAFSEKDPHLNAVEFFPTFIISL